MRNLIQAGGEGENLIQEGKGEGCGGRSNGESGGKYGSIPTAESHILTKSHFKKSY